MSKKLYTLTPLALPEIASRGFTHVAKIRADDLIEAALNTATVLTLATLPAGFFVEKVVIDPIKPFKDKSDVAYNSTTIKVGDEDQDDRFITSKQLNENGAEITAPQYENTAYGPYTADKKLIATIGSMAAKALIDLDVGEVDVLVKAWDVRSLTALK